MRWGSGRRQRADQAGHAGRARMFLVFQNPLYRWLWVSGAFTSMGRMLELMAQGWLVLTLTDSPFWVGMAAGLRGVGTLAFSLLAGVIVDRVDRRRLLIFMQGVGAVIAFLMAYLVFTDLIRLWHILLISLFQGVTMTLNMPARWALTMDLVGRRMLLNAIAANFMAMSVMRVISPSVGGIIISTAGIGGCYLLMGGGFLVSIGALLKIGSVPRVERRQESAWVNLKEGVRYILSSPSLRSLILLGLVVETFGFSHYIMLPVIARDVLEVGATGFGFLSAAGGVGSLVATLVLSSLGDFRAKGWLLVVGAGGFGLFLVLFAASPWFLLSMFLLAVGSGLAISYDSVQGTLLQTLSPDEMRGRVMGFYIFTFGMTPIGGFQAGVIASFLGAPLAVGMGGAVVLLNALRLLKLAPWLQAREAEATAED